MPRPPVGIIKHFQSELVGGPEHRCGICKRTETLREYVQADNTVGVGPCPLTKIEVVRSTVSTFLWNLKATPIITTDEIVAREEDASAVIDPKGQLTYPDPFQESYLTRLQIREGDTVPAYKRTIYEQDICHVLFCARCYRFLREWLFKLEMPNVARAGFHRKRLERYYKLQELGIIVPAKDRRSYIERRNKDRPDRRVTNVFTDLTPRELETKLRESGFEHSPPTEDELRLAKDKEDYGLKE